jgi:transcriptional regulator with XRE-family HTH domain
VVYKIGMPTEPQRRVGLTGNQLVSYNLRRARLLRRWTQEEAAEVLELHLGERWSASSFSVAENACQPGRRRREFTADELLAFVRTFDLPLEWFFLPPGEDFGHVTWMDEPPVAALDARALLASVRGSKSGQSESNHRIEMEIEKEES